MCLVSHQYPNSRLPVFLPDAQRVVDFLFGERQVESVQGVVGERRVRVHASRRSFGSGATSALLGGISRMGLWTTSGDCARIGGGAGFTGAASSRAWGTISG